MWQYYLHFFIFEYCLIFYIQFHVLCGNIAYISSFWSCHHIYFTIILPIFYPFDTPFHALYHNIVPAFLHTATALAASSPRSRIAVCCSEAGLGVEVKGVWPVWPQEHPSHRWPSCPHGNSQRWVWTSTQFLAGSLCQTLCFSFLDISLPDVSLRSSCGQETNLPRSVHTLSQNVTVLNYSVKNM